QVLLHESLQKTAACFDPGGGRFAVFSLQLAALSDQLSEFADILHAGDLFHFETHLESAFHLGDQVEDGLRAHADLPTLKR
ncbi:hypothetical protein RCJ22_11315, partial [Vibrio sp. FNV 38]|nr:hypothetical protein [Vibrio sp. FNV 38]